MLKCYDDFDAPKIYNLSIALKNIILSFAQFLMTSGANNSPYVLCGFRDYNYFINCLFLGNLNFKPPRPKIPNTGNESSVLRPFHCIVCDARFTKKVNLKRHMKYHEGDRKYKCHMCPK